MTKLVGVAGRAGSGKDTFGKVLVEAGYTRSAFADALKVVTATIADEDPQLFFDAESKEQFSYHLQMTRREALQAVGQAVRVSLGPDTWVRRVLHQWKSRGCPPTVITDVRYPNEASLIQAAGGVIIRLTRPGGHLTGAAASHSSEVPLPEDLVDVEIINDGTIGELNAEARKIAEWMNRRQAA